MAGVVSQRQRIYIQLKLQCSLCSLLLITIVRILFLANCVSWTLKHERGILLGGSIEIMNKKALEFVTAKYSILITVDSLETELQIQYWLFRYHWESASLLS